MYAVARHARSSLTGFLVRIGQDSDDVVTFEWLAQIPWTNAGTFDRNGDFFIQSSGKGYKLYQYSGLKDLTGHTKNTDALDWTGCEASTDSCQMYDYGAEWTRDYPDTKLRTENTFYGDT